MKFCKYFIPSEMTRCLSAPWVLGLLMAAAPVNAATTLQEVEVKGWGEGASGGADSASEGAIAGEVYQARPKLRPGDVVETIPGIVATQHSGDGKANQYFLRGFNLDHGTDFSVRLDGMPLNMPTHAHGQGYADLNFLIPELIANVSYRKGPYSTEAGDFSLAGNATLDYLRVLPRPFAEVTLGPNQYRRTLVAGSVTHEDRHWLLAMERMGNDGPWAVPEGLQKSNLVLRHSQGTALNGWQVSAMAYESRWNATDQIPQRTVDQGLLSRFGSLDASDGGQTRRASLSVQGVRSEGTSQTRWNAYAVDSDFKLWSNFTFNLSRPVAGDQFAQSDRRRIYGLEGRHVVASQLGGVEGLLSLNTGWRGDRIDEVGLFLTRARVTDSTVRLDRVNQDMVWLGAQQLLIFNPQWRATLGLRVDSLSYRVDGLEPLYGAANSGQGQASLWQPKAGLAWSASAQHEFYANTGVGFHGNDVRGATITLDPQTGASAQRVPVLVKGIGSELGWRFTPGDTLVTTLALWQLDLDSELLYVGDAGSTEPSRASTRDGLEATVRWRVAPHWRLDLDAAWSRARYSGAAPAGDGDYIVNAVERVLSGGLDWQSGPWQAHLRWRAMGPRALDNANTVQSQATSVWNLATRYALRHDLQIGLEVFNLTDQSGNDIEYFYASCTAREVQTSVCGGGILDRHVHPMEPRTLRVSARLSF